MSQYPERWFGPHQELVVEVLRVALADGFLSRGGAARAGVIVVRSLNQLPHMAPAYYQRSGQEPFEVEWDGLLELLRGEYISPPVQVLPDALSAKITHRIWEITQNFDNDLRQRLPCLPWELRRLLQYLVTDCAVCRAERGTTSAFWERIFACLVAGGIPVGWSGHFPAGRMVVYYPVREG